jgi:MFS family permease
VVITWFARSARIGDDAGTPVGINVAVGAVIITASSFLADAVPAGRPQWRCAVVALGLGLLAVVTADRLAVATVVVPTWMVMNGFLVNHLGTLSWHGWADVERLLALSLAGLTGLAVVAVARLWREQRERWQLGLEVQDLRTEFNKETKQRA